MTIWISTRSVMQNVPQVGARHPSSESVTQVCCLVAGKI